MNTHVKTTHVKLAAVNEADIAPEEWQARIDLAATYRLVAHYGWDDVIYNHSSMRVPGEERKFLIKRHELLYTEVTPANLVKVSMDDDLDESAGVNRPGFTLHGGVLSARPDVNCAVHVHSETGMAIGGLKHGLRMVSQAAIRFYNRVGYHDYEGITEDFGERARINKALGNNRSRPRASSSPWKRPAPSSSRFPRRSAKRPRINTRITIPAAARPIGRLTCAYSTGLIRTGGTKRRWNTDFLSKI